MPIAGKLKLFHTRHQSSIKLARANLWVCQLQFDKWIGDGAWRAAESERADSPLINGQKFALWWQADNLIGIFLKSILQIYFFFPLCNSIRRHCCPCKKSGRLQVRNQRATMAMLLRDKDAMQMSVQRSAFINQYLQCQQAVFSVQANIVAKFRESHQRVPIGRWNSEIFWNCP